jgi:hypothetical protein
MRYNPLTQELYTNTNILLKKLHCPLAKKWEHLANTSIAMAKTCSACNRAVYDTSKLSDSEVQAMLNEAPETCLKVDLEQSNLTITYANCR